MADRSKTWWGRDFLAALEGFMDPGRLARGRSYTGPNRIVKFSIVGGTVKATVLGNINPHFGVYRVPKYTVNVKLTQVSRSQWAKSLKRLGENANWVTHLVLGDMPPTIEQALEGSPVSLLPRGTKEIHSKCSCPDWANPCKHVAGVYYRVAEMLDRDPFLLFELRGLKRSELFDAVRKSDFGTALASEIDLDDMDPLETLQESQFQALAASDLDMAPTDLGAFWLGGTLPRSADIEEPPVSVLPMRRAGDYPEFWTGNKSFLDAMGEVYTRVAKSLPEPKKSTP